MKRIQSACLLQTIHFQLKEGVEQNKAAEDVKKEYEEYKQKLRQRNIRFCILSEEILQDKSILVEIKKQYLNQNCEKYWNE